MTDFIPPADPQDSSQSLPLPQADQPLTRPSSSEAPPLLTPREWGAPGPHLGAPTRSGRKVGGSTPTGPPPVHLAPRYPRRSVAIVALTMAILGFFCAGITGIVGMLMARSDLHAIENGTTDPRYHDLAQAAFIVGLISFLLPALVIGFIAVLLVGAATG